MRDPSVNPDPRRASEADLSADFTDDVFLGGKVVVRQPARGYRAGVDPVLLAAALPATFVGGVLDVGAGAGTIGLCVAARCRGARVTLVERAGELVDFARHSICANGFNDRVTVVAADILQSASFEHLAAGTFDVVAANPPYHDDGAGTPATGALKSASNAMASDDFDGWLRFMARMAAPGGRAIVIHKAEALPKLFAAFDRRFGGLRVLPIHPRAGAPANRVLVCGVKGSRAPLKVLPGFVLHDESGAYTAPANAVFRYGAQLDFL